MVNSCSMPTDARYHSSVTICLAGRAWRRSNTTSELAVASWCSTGSYSCSKQTCPNDVFECLAVANRVTAITASHGESIQRASWQLLRPLKLLVICRSNYRSVSVECRRGGGGSCLDNLSGSSGGETLQVVQVLPYRQMWLREGLREKSRSLPRAKTRRHAHQHRAMLSLQEGGRRGRGIPRFGLWKRPED